MQIKNSTIALLSTREHTKNFQHSKRLNVWDNNASQKSVKQPDLAPGLKNLKKNDGKLSEDLSSLDPKLRTLKLILEALTGKKIHLTDASDFEVEHAQRDMVIKSPSLKTEDPPQMVGWGIDYQETMSISETEQNSIFAAGIVRTTDNKEIRFSIEFKMKREFHASASFSFKAGDALIDPLVVNINTNAAKLTDTKFNFDINSDGTEENLAWLEGSSGFLVFDKNNDGIVNNGTELFGPKTGNGFNELSELDYDKNGFIDENDPAFNNLMIWSGATHEDSKLKNLEHYDIGALALVNVNSVFSLKDETNNTLGKIQKTGIYLKESGQAGTIQQIDLAV